MHNCWLLFRWYDVRDAKSWYLQQTGQYGICKTSHNPSLRDHDLVSIVLFVLHCASQRVHLFLGYVHLMSLGQGRNDVVASVVLSFYHTGSDFSPSYTALHLLIIVLFPETDSAGYHHLVEFSSMANR